VHAASLYVDGIMKAEGNDNIRYTLDETMFGTHIIRVEARDVAGNTAIKEVKIRIYNINIGASTL